MWYSNSNICYVYLEDIPDVSKAIYPSLFSFGLQNVGKNFRHCRWMSRGWTLQELIAPRMVEFYAANWSEIGTKSSLKEDLAKITGIDTRVLDGEPANICNVAERMSWAAWRQTTRVEDMSYCLLGIFGIHMPLLYGEGHRSFMRLQEEILKTTDDLTILARGAYHGRGKSFSRLSTSQSLNPLAVGVSDFRVREISGGAYSAFALEQAWNSSRQYCNKLYPADPPLMLTARGLFVSLQLMQREYGDGKEHVIDWLAYLRCRRNGELVCIILKPTPTPGLVFWDTSSGLFGYCFLHPSTEPSFTTTSICIQHESSTPLPARDVDEIADACSFPIVDIDLSMMDVNCTVLANWGAISSVFPCLLEQPKQLLSDEQRGDNRYLMSIGRLTSEVLCQIGPTDTLLIKFGIQKISCKYWCQVFRVDEPESSMDQLAVSHPPEKWVANRRPHLLWEMHPGFRPSEAKDRVTETLRSGIGDVRISIREFLRGPNKKGVRVDIRVELYRDNRMSFEERIGT